MHGRRFAWLAVILALGLDTADCAYAGLADTPLPKFSDNKQSQLVLQVPGVVQRDRLETVFVCTSLANTPVDIGVELFDSDGQLLNDVHAGSGAVLNVGAGRTVTFATSATATYVETVVIPVAAITQGSARVVASSDKVRCNVTIVDDLVTPPVSLATIAQNVQPTAGATPSGLALPQFSNGHPATHAALFPGLVHRGSVDAAFFCTSLASSPIDVGVELVGTTGTVVNSVAAGSGAVLGVNPGQTVTIATTGTAALLETTVIVVPAVAQGLARVVSTSPDLLCSALVLDSAGAPPSAMTSLGALVSDPTPGPRALPEFSDGKPSVAIKTIPGVMKRGQLQTLFLCTSLATTPVDIGVEVFAGDGTPLNDVSNDVGAVLDVDPGETVTIATSTTQVYIESIVIPLADGVQGSARIVASAKQVACDAVVVDDLVTPPATLTRIGLTVVPAAGPMPSNTPLPAFADGHQATHAAYFPGVIKRFDVETDVFCTSRAATNVDIGVQILRPDGTSANNIQAGNGAVLGVAPGATVTIGTTGTAALLETTVITLTVTAQGLARVVSDSGDIVCSAMLLDAGSDPPTSMSELVGYGAQPAAQQCGNGSVEEPEQCDDGDTDWAAGEGCDATCLTVECGDTNDNGSLAAGDALFALRAAVGSSACDPCVCDADGSAGGNPVTASDALRILRVGVGVNLAMLCPSCT